MPGDAHTCYRTDGTMAVYNGLVGSRVGELARSSCLRLYLFIAIVISMGWGL